MAALAADRNLLFGLLALQNGLIPSGPSAPGTGVTSRVARSPRERR